jgi:hypothetical protein
MKNFLWPLSCYANQCKAFDKFHAMHMQSNNRMNRKLLPNQYLKTTFEFDHLQALVQKKSKVCKPPLVKLISNMLFNFFAITSLGVTSIPHNALSKMEKVEDLVA